MFKKTINYEDFNGQPIKEDFYFNLTKAEIMEMQLEKTGGLTEYIQRIVDSKDVPQLVKLFKELILKSYGVKSDDGKRFIKTKEVVEAFTQTNAYSEFYMELATNADAASAFVNGIIPADLAEEVKKQEKKQLK
jgi:hypothetical protein